MVFIEHNEELVDQSGALGMTGSQLREYQHAIIVSTQNKATILSILLDARHRDGKEVFIVSGREANLQGGSGDMLIVDECHLMKAPEIDGRMLEVEARKREAVDAVFVGGGNNRKERRAWRSRKGDPVPEHRRPERQGHTKRYFKGNFRT